MLVPHLSVAIVSVNQAGITTSLSHGTKRFRDRVDAINTVGKAPVTGAILTATDHPIRDSMEHSLVAEYLLRVTAERLGQNVHLKIRMHDELLSFPGVANYRASLGKLR